MPADDYRVAGDPDALRRENELLSLENTYLKTRIASLEQELARLRRQSGQAPGRAQSAERAERRG
jgi:hypothetical protein